MIEKINWLTPETNNQLAYQYWNDEEVEKEKPYYCDTTECNKVYDYVQKIGVYYDLEALLNNISPDCRAISLASGVCWEAKLLIEHGIKKMDFLDFSKHRIMEIAPNVLQYLNCPDDCHVRLIWGSYYDVRMPDDSYDCIILSEALMMAEYPNRLLHECRRILSKGGGLLIVGEPKLEMSIIQKIKRLIGRAIGINVIVPDISGAHNYLLSEYKFYFKKNEFTINYIGKDNPKFWYFCLKG